MFPSFGSEYSPGDLLSSKTFEKVASLDVETVSADGTKTHVCHRSIDSSKLLMELCTMLDCSNGQQMVNFILNAGERVEPLMNFLYSQPHFFPCFGFSVIKKENESCFEVSNAENSNADLMVSKTSSGVFFLCVLTCKIPIKDHDLIMQKFDYVLQELPSISNKHCEFFNVESIKVTVFVNWNEMICNQMTAQEALESIIKFGKEKNKHQIISFEVDDFTKCLPQRPLPLDPSFEKCYRLMRSIKNKGAEFLQIYDSKKKKGEKYVASRLKQSLIDLEKDLKQTYFLKYEYIERLNGIFADAVEILESALKRWSSNGTALDTSLFQMIETCLTSVLIKFNNGKCIIRDNTVFYNADKMEILWEYFEKKPFIALKSCNNDFKQWVTPKFLQDYPLCYVRNFPSIPDSCVLCDDAIYGFGTVTLKKPCRKQKTKFEYEAFCCVNPEHKYGRYWKCTSCTDYVTSNGKETVCKCGVSNFNNVEFRCSFSDGKICTKKSAQASRQRTVNPDNVDIKDTKSFNIVLFGPVGSGKSTLINAAMNYMGYSTYEKASSRELIAPIPYKFSIFDVNYQEHFVCSKQIPENCPENFESTSGITQRPHVYECYSNGKTYHFIDTISYGTSMKDGLFSNLNLWKNLKHIDGIWITISATQTLNDDFSWLHRIVKCIPKKLFSRVYFVFTNIQGKHSLRLNSNVAAVAKFVSRFKEFPFNEKNVYAIENNCLKSLYAQRDGCSLTDVQDSLNNTWMESRRVLLDLLDKSSVSTSHDEDVFFLNNLLFLYLRLKRLCSEEELIQCFDLLSYNFTPSSSSLIKDNPPSYGDVMKSLQQIKCGIPGDSQQYKLLVEFLETFESFVKNQSPGAVATAAKYLFSLFK